MDKTYGNVKGGFRLDLTDHTDGNLKGKEPGFSGSVKSVRSCPKKKMLGLV